MTLSTLVDRASVPHLDTGVVGVVPLFRPDGQCLEGIRRLADQVAHVVLVDDGSPEDPAPLVGLLGRANVRLVRLGANHGIARALNEGIRIALDELAAGHVLTMDQDTVLDPDYVRSARRALGLLRDGGLAVAAVAAGVVDGKPTPSQDDVGGLPFRTTHETVQSGLVFPAETIRALGPFDESFFIDCVDTDYILRGVSRGLPTVVVPGCRMQHAMGAGIRVRLPFPFRRRDRVVPYHGPVRRYYITRNRVRLVARHARHSPRWAVRQTGEQTRSAVADLVFGADRVALLIATMAGTVDGFGRRGGAIPAGLERRLRACIARWT